ncbi:Hypothetical_protein [Hexamita inflata]|uniref:Hypothetical_protein n=1 Tax=Hexamita inflata TaxID=28002 RepID=A0ABP1GJ22_9EUKA
MGRPTELSQILLFIQNTASQSELSGTDIQAVVWLRRASQYVHLLASMTYLKATKTACSVKQCVSVVANLKLYFEPQFGCPVIYGLQQFVNIVLVNHSLFVSCISIKISNPHFKNYICAFTLKYSWVKSSLYKCMGLRHVQVIPYIQNMQTDAFYV